VPAVFHAAGSGAAAQSHPGAGALPADKPEPRTPGPSGWTEILRRPELRARGRGRSEAYYPHLLPPAYGFLVLPLFCHAAPISPRIQVRELTSVPEKK